jgi:porin
MDRVWALGTACVPPRLCPRTRCTMIERFAIVLSVMVLLDVSLGTNAAAEEATSAYPYSGDLSTRSTLTGDWGGVRNDLAAKGITFDASLTQIEQGVVDGGKNGSWEYGGRGNLTGDLDTQKLGLWPGGFLKVELEGNWSDSVIAKTGALLPVNTNQLFPLPTGNNVALPNLTFAQFVSPYAGAVVGKFDTMLSGDANEFAHGKGDRQFFNLAFNINPTLLMVVPAATLGAGVIVLPTKDPSAAIVSLSVLSSTGKASTSGLDDLSSDNLSFVGEGRFRTDFFGLTGHQLVGAGYSNKQFTQLDQRIGSVIENRALAKKDGTWAVYYNFDQFLYELDKSAGRGVGLFGRFGASDGNPNPVHYFGTIGVGGKGLLPDRPLDRLGMGYYYLAVASPTLQVPIAGAKSFLRDEWGFEAFYNIALTPWMLVTPDVQVIGPSQKRQIADGQHVETATVLGIRGQLIF